MLDYWTIIENRMKELGISWYRLEMDTGLNRATIIKARKQKRNLKFDATAKIASYLRMSLDELSPYSPSNQSFDSEITKESE